MGSEVIPLSTADRDASTDERPSWVGSPASKMVARVASAMARELDLDRAIETVLRETKTTLGAMAGHVYLYDESPPRLRLAGHYNLPDDLRARVADVPLDSPLLAARTARTRRVEHADERTTASDPSLQLAHEILVRVGATSILSIPLIAHDRLMGVLTCALVRPLSTIELGFVEAVGEIFALGIENAAAMERGRRHRARFEALREASLAMASNDGAPTVLQVIVDRAREIAGARCAFLGVLAPEQADSFEPCVHSGIDGDVLRAIGRPPPPIGLLGAVSRGPVRVPDLTRDPRFGSFPAGHPTMTSFLGVPLLANGRCLGVLYLGDKLDAPEFDEHDQRIIEALAQHAVLAVERLQSRQALERELVARRRAEAAALASERELRSVFDHALEAMIVLDDQLMIVEANPAARALLGVYEARGRRLPELVAACDPPVDEVRRRALRRPRQLADVRVTRLDGEPRELELAVVPSFMPGRHLTIARDVTARRRAEIEVRRWADAFAHAQWGVVISDAEGTTLLSTNRAFAEMHGYTVDELVGRPIVDLVAPELRGKLAEWRRRAIHEGHFTWEAIHVRKDGSVFPLLGDVTIVRDEAGRVLYRVANMQDLSERKRHERERERLLEQLQNERNWLRAVIDEAPVGILLVAGADGARVIANRRADVQHGFRHAPARGLAQFEGTIYTPDGRPCSTEEFLTSRALRGEAGRAELVVRRPDGTELPVFASSAPVHDAAGRVAGAVLVVADISAIKELERVREEWTSMVAHDLRQPVSVIALSASLLPQQREEIEERERQLLKRVTAATQRLQRMIDDLLDISRLQAGRLALSRRSSAPLAIVRRAVEEAAAGAADRAIEIDAPEALPDVDVDPDRVHQVLSNLLSNAMKYGAPGTPIRVTVTASGEEAEIAVTNEGPGIAAAEQAKLFDRFYRARGARRAPGIGLGLHITKGLVEAHGGRIRVESAPEGPTTFRFTVPTARGR